MLAGGLTRWWVDAFSRWLKSLESAVPAQRDRDRQVCDDLPGSCTVWRSADTVILAVFFTEASSAWLWVNSSTNTYPTRSKAIPGGGN